MPPRSDLAPATNGENAVPGEEDIIPGAEYPVVLAVPPKQEFHFRGRIVSIERGPQELGLSDADWASLHLEEGDE